MPRVITTSPKATSWSRSWMRPALPWRAVDPGGLSCLIFAGLTRMVGRERIPVRRSCVSPGATAPRWSTNRANADYRRRGCATYGASPRTEKEPRPGHALWSAGPERGVSERSPLRRLLEDRLHGRSDFRRGRRDGDADIAQDLHLLGG